MNLKPLRGLVLITRENPEEFIGRIVVPEAYRKYSWRAKIESCGDDVVGLTVGDEILYLRDKTVLPFKERHLALTNSRDVIAKIGVERDCEIILPLNDFVLIRLDENKQDGFKLFEKHTEHTVVSGTVLRVGSGCTDVKPQMRVWFKTAKFLKCREDSEELFLIRENEIELFEEKA